MRELREQILCEKNSSGATGATGAKKELEKNNNNILLELIDWFFRV